MIFFNRFNTTPLYRELLKGYAYSLIGKEYEWLGSFEVSILHIVVNSRYIYVGC